MNYFKQILFELKTRKMVTWVSISGIALSIFLIMALFMSDRLVNISIAPESNRHRVLMGINIDFRSGNGNSGSGMGIDYDLARRLYENLDGVEKISYFAYEWYPYDIGLPGKKTFQFQGVEADDEFWNIYDYKFLSGSPFEKEEIKSQRKMAIITEAVARAIFKETNVAGRQVDIDGEPYVIKGVVEDSFPLLPDGTIKVFTNFTNDFNTSFGEGIFGKAGVRLLMKEGVEPRHIKRQVEKRYADINFAFEKEDKKLEYHLQPYTAEEMTAGSFGSNNDPDLKMKTRLRGLVYAMLLLLPAINLSSMTHSRLRKRISEIGVRRAFGAKRRSIISQIFTENLLISFIGGAIGLGFSLLFLAFISQYFITATTFNFESIGDFNPIKMVWHVFDFSAFFIAFGACFVLNILSAFVPAWKASAIQPAVAIAKTR